MALRAPAGVLAITRDLESAGFEAWCVGGAVRDALLGHAHLDWDLATNATPDQVRTIFGRRRTIPVGIDFGTVGVLDSDGILHEVTTFRRDVQTDGRHAQVEFGASLDEDLSRRDFTINAMAFSATSGELRDPFGGRADLARGLVRAVGNPAERMREDRLRALRGIRFAARLSFDLEASTWEAIRASATHLTRLSAERVKQELEKTMDQVKAPSAALVRWRESGAFRALIPELEQVRDSTLRAVDCAAQPGPSRRPGRRLIRFAILFGDVPPDQALQAASRLRFSKSDAHWIAALTERAQAIAPAIVDRLATGEPADVDVRRWIAAIGRTHLPALFRVMSARWASKRGEGDHEMPTARAVQGLYRRCLRSALTEPVDLRDLAVDGDDLRQAGIAPGPGLGKILSELLEIVIADPRANSRERLLEEARAIRGRG